MSVVGIIGAGAWGTALAQTVAANGHEVRLWMRDDALAAQINASRLNDRYLPGVSLSPQIRATSDLAWLSDAEFNLVVTPAQHMRSVLDNLGRSGQPLVLCSKGIEAGSLQLMSEVAAELHPRSPIAVLSGPTFAHEVAAGLPTAVTLACADAQVGRLLADWLARPTFRLYRSDDVVGAEVGGATKNVLAIACGAVEGRGLGQNAAAALIARGFAEMTRFGAARGACRETLAGLSGLGDLVLTCSSARSRNFSLGLGLGRGESADVLLSHRHTVAEGAATAPVLAEAARTIGVEMPIVEAVRDLLDGTIAIDAAVERLLARPIGVEAAR